MITMEVSKEYKAQVPHVRDEELTRAVQEAYPDKAEKILRIIYRDMYGSTRLKSGIYPWDLAAIMIRHQWPHKFILNGEVTKFNQYMSGVYW